MMKKKVLFGMMGAMALAFTACTSEEELAPVNPTFDGNAVKTQFTLNVGQANFGTRMTAANVQANSVEAANRFLGMENMTLFAFNAEPANGSATTTKFTLGTLAAKEMTQTHSNKFYTLQIPVGTNNFVFYGEAPAGQKADNGELTNTVASATTLAGVEFALTKRATDAFATTGNEIAGKLTAIAAATGWKTTTVEPLKTMYTQFTTTTGKIRAGYGAAVIRMVDELKAAAENVKAMNAPVGNATPSEAYTVADAILTAIQGNSVTSYSAFPGADMPAGAAQLVCDNGTFSYVNANNPANAFGSIVAGESIDPAKIAYPAELVYWDNSPLRHSSVSKDASDYPDGVTKWITDSEWDNDWTIGAVAATTRAIAMKENINYGVAGLYSKVTWTPGNYADNRKAQALWDASIADADKTDETFTVADGSFTLTGVLVGGQPEKANWQLLPAANSAFNWAVYDNKVNADNKESYTLLLDNYAAEAKSVLVALEFTNNLTHKVKKMVDGEETEGNEPADFYGKDGRIIAGGKFYLVGKLTVPEEAEWDVAYANTRIEEAIRIFAQDRMTVANFKFQPDALKYAYETIPDLTSVSMLFGLSVDIEWLDGLSFDVDFGTAPVTPGGN